MSTKACENTGKEFTIRYIGMDAIGCFTGKDEKTVALAAFDWMVERGEGLDFQPFLEEMTFEIDEDGLCYEPVLDEERFTNKEDIVAHVRKTCDSFKKLKKICREYGNDYFEGFDGWKMESSSKGWKVKFFQT